jgi:hypothetical protein
VDQAKELMKDTQIRKHFGIAVVSELLIVVNLGKSG